MVTRLDLLRCPACGAETVRRRGNEIVLVGCGEDEDHVVSIYLEPGGHGEVLCRCGRVERHEYQEETNG